MFKHIGDWYQREKKIIGSSLAIGFAVMLCSGFYSAQYAQKIQSGIANEVVRFHVLANGDADFDQELKLKVRDAVLENFREELSTSKSREETKQMLEGRLDEIVLCAKEVVQAEKYDYEVSARLAKAYFPSKTYGDVTFPAGEYEALRIEIGEAVGQNWWCVMYPPLCFVDVTKGEIPEEDKSELKNILTEDEYDIVLSKAGKDISVKIKFKIVEWWQERTNRIEQELLLFQR